ncbi:MAG: mechanosensitive ion channel family protein [Flavobacteriales bacterium]
MKKFNEFMNGSFLIGNYPLTIGTLSTVLIIIIFTKLLLWILRKILFRHKNIKKYEEGNLHSLFQIIKYIIWIITILIILDTLGLELNVLFAGSAALLVGIGLGLQSTFKDFISGIILLFEGSIKVGDILEIDNDVVKIKKIRLRTSVAINRDDIIIILPNSLITTNKVINWSHQTKKTRFDIKVGVAYGSDVDLIISILKESASEYLNNEGTSNINVQFLDFGSSSLNFMLLFYSKDIFRIETIKSDIRKVINRKFIKNKITIPYPQIDLHVK